MVTLCGEKGLLLVHALHFSTEFTHDSTLFSTCHNRRNPGSRKCHSELRPYLDAYSAVLKQDVSGRNAVWAICQRHALLYSASASHPEVTTFKYPSSYVQPGSQMARLLFYPSLIVWPICTQSWALVQFNGSYCVVLLSSVIICKWVKKESLCWPIKII